MTPLRSALRCHGLRVNLRPPDAPAGGCCPPMCPPDGLAGSGCPSGHRFNSSPRHRSAKRVGVGGKSHSSKLSCPQGHGFTDPDGMTTGHDGKSVSDRTPCAGGNLEPVTPTRCALRCHGLRVNRCPVGHHRSGWMTLDGEIGRASCRERV